MPEQDKELNQETQTEVKETPKDQPPDKEGIVYEQAFDGQTVKLTEDQLNRVVYLGLLKASETSDKTKPPKTEEPKKEVESAKTETKDRYDELRAELTRRDQKQIIEDVEDMLEDVETDPYFGRTLRQQAFIAIAEAQQAGKPYSTKKIVKGLVGEYNKAMEKYKPKVDLAQKEKDKDATKFTGGGKTAGQDAPKPLGRSAFRSGELAKRISEHLNKLGE